MWRARSASDKTDDWPFWYVTDDNPADANKTAQAYEMVTGHKWPPVHAFVSRDGAILLAEALNSETPSLKVPRGKEGE